MTNNSESEITLVNLFTVKPEKQQSTANQVAEIYKTVVSKQPGFICARIHKSLDGTKVAAVARWESQEALEAMQQTSDFQNAIPSLEHEIVSAEPHIYEVICILGETGA
ncbi:antibiotic biosynthesis monooxygenase [Brasilonema bromeliae]|uniref:antibiotic biosynthesis monooxygenase n=1 Tax=Brasilonema bromeliae TaxID=383615 RepID=UPI00145E7723